MKNAHERKHYYKMERHLKGNSGYISMIILCVLIQNAYALDSAIKMDYSVIVDAGSSGSRVHIYAWPRGSWEEGQSGNLPDIQEVNNTKITPGISSFVGNLEGLDAYLAKLINAARHSIPQAQYKDTPFYLLATAGMRLLPEVAANDIIDAVDSILLDPDKNPFQYESLNNRILSGEEEGVFAWITVNYLRSYFDYGSTSDVAGIIELGGASVQITFLHDGSILADKFPIYIAGKVYPLYVHSYLGFGQERVIERTQILTTQKTTQQENGRYLNPCMLRGDNLTATIQGNTDPVHFTGTGQPSECKEYLDDIVYSSPSEFWCLPKPCAIGTVYQPSIDPKMPFYALSAFQFALISLNVLDDLDHSFTPAEVELAANRYCSKSISEVEDMLKRYDSKFNSIECMIGLYTSVLLEKGLKFSNTSDQVYAKNKINGRRINWPLGALIYEQERRHVECETDALFLSSAAVISSESFSMFIFMPVAFHNCYLIVRYLGSFKH